MQKGPLVLNLQSARLPLCEPDVWTEPKAAHWNVAQYSRRLCTIKYHQVRVPRGRNPPLPQRAPRCTKQKQPGCRIWQMVQLLCLPRRSKNSRTGSIPIPMLIFDQMLTLSLGGSQYQHMGLSSQPSDFRRRLQQLQPRPLASNGHELYRLIFDPWTHFIKPTSIYNMD